MQRKFQWYCRLTWTHWQTSQTAETLFRKNLLHSFRLSQSILHTVLELLLAQMQTSSQNRRNCPFLNNLCIKMGWTVNLSSVWETEHSGKMVQRPKMHFANANAYFFHSSFNKLPFYWQVQLWWERQRSSKVQAFMGQMLTLFPSHRHSFWLLVLTALPTLNLSLCDHATFRET